MQVSFFRSLCRDELSIQPAIHPSTYLRNGGFEPSGRVFAVLPWPLGLGTYYVYYCFFYHTPLIYGNDYLAGFKSTFIYSCTECFTVIFEIIDPFLLYRLRGTLREQPTNWTIFGSHSMTERPVWSHFPRTRQCLLPCSLMFETNDDDCC